MKIVYFNYMWDLWGTCIGSTIKSLELLNALSACGHDVKYYWRYDEFSRDAGPKSEESNNSFRDKLKKYFGRYLHEPNQVFKNIRSIFEEPKILNEEKPDLVISRLHSYVFSSAVVSKKTHMPYLIEIDSPGVYENLNFQKYYYATEWLLNYLESKHINSGRAAFTVSHQLKEYFSNRGISREKISVIPNGANPKIFSPEIATNGITEQYDLYNQVVVGFVGSFIFWHGVENLISVIQQTIEKFDHVKFLMVGKGGPLEPMLRKFIEENKLEDRVVLTGYVLHEDVPKYIAAMDIVLAPYPDLEFFYYSPIKIYEYMSCGRPVISTQVGQIGEVIDNHKTGFLTKPNDINQICYYISELVQQPKLREKVGLSARKEILEKHTWQSRGQQLSELCEKCI